MKLTAKSDIKVMLKAGYKYLELLARNRTACNIFAKVKIKPVNPHLSYMLKQKYNSQKEFKY